MARRETGGALLAVLWLSAALAAIAFSLAATVRGEVERTSTAVDGTRAYYLAAGGIERTALHMLWNWYKPDIPPAFRTTSRSRDFLEFPTGRVRVEIVPEASKLNINLARPEEILRLLVALGAEPERAQLITEAIVDWRGGPQASGPSGFDQYYLSLSPSFRAGHTSFEQIEELLVVRGMTPEIFYGSYKPAGAAPGAPLVRTTGFSDCVSVYGTTDRFDVNTADPALLVAVGVPPDYVAALAERRRVQPFLDDAELAAFSQGNPAFARLRVGGHSIFTLRATARPRLPDGKLSDAARTTAAVLKFMPGKPEPIHFLRWYDTAWGAQ